MAGGVLSLPPESLLDDERTVRSDVERSMCVSLTPAASCDIVVSSASMQCTMKCCSVVTIAA